ncbi:Calmodulin-binding transcription activator 3 [Striga hermonthica]|uniref:Calmodulin-binding transcription activator 3 n=1 Tax=Striga hermonthica TaxID=68872 RepID=A0A9N7RC89_STRHE|nr:Calmodulin-binding transcription activator 3 [Striga hermonthica]
MVVPSAFPPRSGGCGAPGNGRAHAPGTHGLPQCSSLRVLRYFRKDGHNWRKKKDGKTVKEAHERLKAGSVDVLHCYYAHGEENENFQRRSYWMLEEELSHIVLVHYREVKGSRANYNRFRDADVTPNSGQNPDVSNSTMYGSEASRSRQYDHQGASQVTDTTSHNSTQASEREDAESAYRHEANAVLQSIRELQLPAKQKMEVGSIPYYPVPTSNNYQGQLSALPDTSFGNIQQGETSEITTDISFTYGLHRNDVPTWEKIVESSNSGFESVNFQSSLASTQSSAVSIMPGQDNQLFDQAFTGVFGKRQELGSHSGGIEAWQASESDSSQMSKWSTDQKLDGNLNLGQNTYYSSVGQPLLNDRRTKPNDANQVEISDSLGLPDIHLTEQNGNTVESSLRSDCSQNLNLDNKTNYSALRQPLLDGVMREGLRKLDSFDRWMSKELGDVAESTMHPGSGVYWETVGSEDGDESGISTQALDNYVLGPSLSQDQLFSIIDFSPNWAFSGTEIKVLISGRFLRSYDQVEKYGWACMFGEIEVPAQIVGDGVLRCLTPAHETGRVPFYITCSNRLACSEVREFEFLGSVQDVDLGDTSDETLLHMRFVKLLSLGSSTSEASVQAISPRTSELCLKISALLRDDTEWEQMLNITKQDEFSADKVKDQLLQKLLKEKLHDWLLQKVGEGDKGPGVLDEGGQGVLHFAAALGYDWAIPPTIAAAVETVSERTATPAGDEGDQTHGLSLQDSLAAVRNATQAAARIHQVFRLQSFQRKQLEEYSDGKFRTSNERALSLLAGKSKRSGQHNEPVLAAAVRIQNKFRSWKGRKDFLLIRQRVIKIQAHVRGHQVRKNYRKIIWSVGILDKVILRWRRKGRGLSRFKTETQATDSSMVDTETNEDDYDFLKEGRKKTEERLQKALARVKSMVQYPEARDQYRRLLNVVSEMQEAKATYDKVLNNPEVDFDDDLIDFEALLNDDTFMPTAS